MAKKIFKYKLSVRGYELDSFNHVNNAVYLQYFEQARWEIINELGLFKIFQETGNFLVVIGTHIRYINELKIFEKINIETRMLKEGPFLLFKHRMFNDKETKSRATVKCLFLTKDRIPLDIPDFIEPYIND